MSINDLQSMGIVSTDICEGISYVILDKTFNCEEVHRMLYDEVINKKRDQLQIVTSKLAEQTNEYAYYVKETLEELNTDYTKQVVILIIGKKELPKDFRIFSQIELQ